MGNKMSFFRRKADKSKTEYDIVKRTKKENFTYLNQFVKRGQTVFIGDSITEIYNLKDLYWQYEEEHNTHVYNRGISGDTSDRLLERLHDNALIIEPEILVVLVGTNDLGAGFKPEFTVENIGRIIDCCREECPKAKIIVQSVYPVNRSISPAMVGRRKNSDIIYINEKLRELCEERRVIFADIHPCLCNGKGTLNKDLTYDGLHLNARGFDVVTKKLLSIIVD